MTFLNPESAHPDTAEFAIHLAQTAGLPERLNTGPQYPRDLSDIAKLYLRDLEATFRGIKEEIARTKKRDGYVIDDIFMTVNDTLISHSEYMYLANYTWMMVVLNNINGQERPAPQHLRQPRHRLNVLEIIKNIPPELH